MRKSKRYSLPKRINYAVIVDGETEVWYFQMLKRNEPALQVNIEPKIPVKKRLSDQYEKVCELSEDFSKVFWVIDLDKIIQDNQVEQLRSYFAKFKRKVNTNIVTIINYPCLEFWYILHYEQTLKSFMKCKNAEKYLKKYLPDYRKSRKYYTRQDNDIYLKHKSRLPVAVENAKKTNLESFFEIDRGISEMNLFFEHKHIREIWTKV